MISTPIPTETSGRPASEPAADNILAPAKIADAIPLSVHLPVDARGVALGILATVALVFALDWAQPFLITLLIGILFAYTLNPLVVWLERIRIPRVVGASLVMVAVICALVFGTYALRGQVQEILAQLPEAASKLSTGLDKMRSGPLSNMKDVQAAASTIEKATNQADISALPKQRTTHVVIDQPPSSSATSCGLAQSDRHRPSSMMLFWCSFSDWRRYVQAQAGAAAGRRCLKEDYCAYLDDINHSIQKYVHAVGDQCVGGLLTWIVLIIWKTPGPGRRRRFAACHPLCGPALTAIILGMAAFMQFDSFSMGLLAAGASLAIAIFVGTIIATWMTGKFAKMNTAAVFVSLLFWAWLWGVWGMLLGIPIIVIVKVVSQHVEQLHPVAELLGVRLAPSSWRAGSSR